VGTLPGGEEMFESDRSQGRYSWNGDPDGLDWVPSGECVAAAEFWGSSITFGTRAERDWCLDTYRRWIEGGRRRTKDGKPAHWVLVADPDDIMTRRHLAELREAREAAVADPSGPKRPSVAPTPAPKAEPEPDSKAEAQASGWSRALGIVRHNPLRRSQTAVGSRERSARRRARLADEKRQEQGS
jgi:hypothetical protein